MQNLDFIVNFDPSKDTTQELTERIIYNAFIERRVKSKKPAVIFVSGDSGEGKSNASLTINHIINKTTGADPAGLTLSNLDISNVYTPFEYPTKLDALLHNKEYKRYRVLCVHEARLLVRAKNWYDFVNQAISDVNALSRAVKPLVFIIISQFIRDVSNDVRYSINYYIKVNRPYARNTRAEIWVLWKDDNELDRPKLRKRKLTGYLRYPNGKLRLFKPRWFEFGRVAYEVEKEFNKRDSEEKAKIIRLKTSKIIKTMQQELNVDTGRVDRAAEFYLKPENYEELKKLGRVVRKKWKLNAEAAGVLDFSRDEVKEFESLLSDGLKKQNYISEDEYI